jgi:transcriptional regulator with XRE-family HTH domain
MQEPKPLRQLREVAGMTQLDVAFALKVTPQTVYNWERGTREPKGSHLQQLARLYKVSADDILLADAESKEGKMLAAA